MANKRDLKKAIRIACGNMAGECFRASEGASEADIEKWEDVVINVAVMQTQAIAKVGEKCPHKPKAFESPKAYRKARKQFFAEAEREITDFMRSKGEEIAKAMNELSKK